ncbi:MAG: alkaline shock response membrane anchor protein AmaP [Actinomycetota bacterium]|nr:alkaline shock response membrane anchor protein AmaP [Actinomycetota bacterium]
MTDPLVLRGPEGAITVAPAALEHLVVRAAQSVDGARVRRPKRSVEVAHGAGRASVSFELAVEHGAPVPELARAVQERVAEAVAATSGLEVDRVDVSVEEIA